MSSIAEQKVLLYFHDPMCSWCWSFDAVFERLLKKLPDDLVVKRILGGLAKDTNEPMPTEMQEMLENTWATIEHEVPGVTFNFDFWKENKPRRSTYPACRAVIAARRQGDLYDVMMTKAIQKAYYKDAKNPSDDEVLLSIANEMGLDTTLFSSHLNSDEVNQELQSEIEFTRSVGVSSFPSLLLQARTNYWHVQHDYNDEERMRTRINTILKTNN